jgi:hypothetical protein
MTSKLAPAIPLDQIYPALESNVFGPTKIRAFREDDEFRSFPSRLQQITSVVKFSEEHYQTTPSQGSLARSFEAHPTVVTQSLKHGYTLPDIHAKASLLSPAEEDAIIQWITLNSQKAKHTTRSQILSYATETFKKHLSRGWVNSFLSRRRSDLWETQSQPQEESRLSVPRGFLLRTLDALQTHVNGHFCDLVLNLAEIGVSEWEDRKPKKKCQTDGSERPFNLA